MTDANFRAVSTTCMLEKATRGAPHPERVAQHSIQRCLAFATEPLGDAAPGVACKLGQLIAAGRFS